jgi:F-type H+-transporting ATPase subunit b
MTNLLALLQEAAHVAQETQAPVIDHGGAGDGGGPFAINPGLIIWTLLVFVILLGLLWKFAFPSIVRSVEERERRIQKQLEDAEKANAEAQRLLEEHKKQIAAARNEAQDILAKAKTVSQKEREMLLAKAREEYDALLSRARKDIDAEKEKAIQALRREAVDLSIAAASRVIEANLDTDANRKLVTDFLESLGKSEKR